MLTIHTKGAGTIINLTSYEFLLGGVYESMHTGGMNITGQLVTILLVFGLPIMIITAISLGLSQNRRIKELNKKVDRLAAEIHKED
ncbi:hypothetical protein LCL89_09550 [Halobacillus yeomjeoni]|uniref:LapA family protein n=1 Tax=Halobacillus yeomjeoni TaxID=311194 RepID=UPI001CD5228A|nr:LapA family protein [Halobacillus yeomjeoni]MCA0984289.1 hypothetical protein [Halobacillus yeomjeoni]